MSRSIVIRGLSMGQLQSSGAMLKKYSESHVEGDARKSQDECIYRLRTRKTRYAPILTSNTTKLRDQIGSGAAKAAEAEYRHEQRISRKPDKAAKRKRYRGPAVPTIIFGHRDSDPLEYTGIAAKVDDRGRRPFPFHAFWNGTRVVPRIS